MTKTDNAQNTPNPENEDQQGGDAPQSFGEHLHQAGSAQAPNGEAIEKIAALESALAESKDRMMRALAEAENTRRRAAKDREDSIKFATAGFARDLIDFSDNFRRAIESVPEEVRNGGDERLQNVFSGLEAMERDLLALFEKNHIKKIVPMDEPFDANFHEAMFEAPVPGKPGGLVIEVIEPGYVLHGRLLRPARVGISKGDVSASGGSSDSGHTLDTQI